MKRRFYKKCAMEVLYEKEVLYEVFRGFRTLKCVVTIENTEVCADFCSHIRLYVDEFEVGNQMY